MTALLYNIMFVRGSSLPNKNNNMQRFYEGTVEINGIKVVYELNDNYDCMIYELDNDEEHYGEYPEYEEEM